MVILKVMLKFAMNNTPGSTIELFIEWVRNSQIDWQNIIMASTI